MFNERIKQLHKDCQIPQRQFAAALEVDTATYCKIEKGERRVKAEQVVIAELLQTNKGKLLTLWLANQVSAVVTDKQKIADKAFKLHAKQILLKYKKSKT